MPADKLTGSRVEAAMAHAFAKAKAATGGENAHYIPYLANVDPSLLGLSVCLVDGTCLSLGDAAHPFGVESISKVFTAALILRQLGPEAVRQKIGADATGLPFNSIMAIILENHSPSTPLVNAGAISACSLVTPAGDADAKWAAITGMFEDLCGSPAPLIDELYRSESATNFDNRSIAWLLKDYGRIYDDVDLSLDLYTRQCSLAVTAEQLAHAAATIANGGVSPTDGREVLSADLARKLTSLICTVGFYQSTGDWLYRTGIPAKSGVGGGILAVVPGVMGIGAFAPPLDAAGNSVRGQEAVAALGEELGLNVFQG